MATFDDVRRMALALPETSEGSAFGTTHWRVADKGFVWERPLRKKDLAALGERAPKGPILGAHVEHVGIKEALIATDANVYFTTPHFDGYAAILVQLDHIAPADLNELIVEAWLARAPKPLVKAFLSRSAGSDTVASW